MLSYAYFAAANIVTGTIELAQLDFRILNNFATLNTFEDNLVMPDEVLDNAITILNARDEQGSDTEGLVPIFIKAKPILTIGGQDSLHFLHIQLNNPDEWVQGEDNFLYFKGELAPSESVQFNNYFLLSYLISNEYQDAQVYLALEVEAVQADESAYQSIWPDAPLEWVQSVFE